MAEGSLLGAAFQGDVAAIVKCLESPNVNVNQPTSDWGGTPLMCAVQRRHAQVCRLLLARRADFRVLDPFGQTCLHRAAQSGDPAVTEVLLEYAPVDLRNDSGQTALHIAAEAGSTDVIEVLLKYRADLLVEDKNGATPLKLASDKRHREAATLLERLIQEREFSLPPELQSHAAQVLSAYQHALHQGRKRLQRQRIIIIGDRQTGKSWLWAELLGIQVSDFAEPDTLKKAYCADNVVYNIRKGQFSPWAENKCDLRKTTPLLYEQHDMEVARLLLLDILQSPLGRVACSRLAQNHMQQLVDKLRREVRDENFDNTLTQSKATQPTRHRSTITAVTITASHDVTAGRGLTASMQSTFRPPPFQASDHNQTTESGGQSEPTSSNTSSIPPRIIKQITAKWRQVLKQGVAVLSDREPEFTEVHISKLSGSPQLWNLITPFLPHTALYLAAYNMANAPDTPPAVPVQAAHPTDQQEQVFCSQLGTVMSLEPPYNYSHRTYEDQKQRMPAFIVCGIDRRTSRMPNQRQYQKFRALADRINHSSVGCHMVEGGAGNVLLDTVVHDEENAPPPKISFLRRQIDHTMRDLLTQRGNSSMVPLAWLKLEDCFHKVRSTGCYFLSVRNDCLELAREATCNVINDIFSLSNALEYFHSMGWICYFSRVPCLSDTVFTDPSWLINSLSGMFGVMDSVLPANAHTSSILLHESGKLDEALMDYCDQYFKGYAQLNPGRSILEDLDLAAVSCVQDEKCMFVPGAVSTDLYKYSLDGKLPDGNPPALHLVFPDQLQVFGFLQRFIVYMLRNWQPDCVALALGSAQLWMDGGSWQLVAVETSDSIAVLFVDPALALPPDERQQADASIAAENTCANDGSSTTLSSDSASRSSIGTTACTSLLAASHCPQVFDFISECISTLRDHWFPSLAVDVCFEAAMVGFKSTTLDPGAADGQTPQPEKYVTWEQCSDLSSTWCWLNRT